MRSPDFGWLLRKDWRELLASRACWVLLLAAGLLAGHAFLTGVEAYAEMSGAGGGPAALAQGLSPLDGIVVPVFGALSLAAMLLLPFVVIRLVAHEVATGAWKLLVQGPASIPGLLTSKVVVLVGAWLLTSVPAFLALALWRLAGNHLHSGETLVVVLGNMLFAWITVGIAAAAAAAMEGEANAAIVTLGFTIGCWALEFVGAARGGFVATLAEYTPGFMLRSFEMGLVRANGVIVSLTIGAAGIVMAAIWLQLGVPRGRRWQRSGGVAVITVLLCVSASRLRSSWDLSEDRRNSFAPADEAALRTLREPLRIEVHLAQEDPRLADFRRGVIDKLRRTIPRLEISYVARTRTGLFEQADSLYGTISYHIGPRTASSRSVTAPIVLDLIYALSGTTPPLPAESAYPGYPLVKRPAAISWIFFVGWPALLAAVFATRRTLRSRHR